MSTDNKEWNALDALKRIAKRYEENSQCKLTCYNRDEFHCAICRDKACYEPMTESMAEFKKDLEELMNK